MYWHSLLPTGHMLEEPNRKRAHARVSLIFFLRAIPVIRRCLLVDVCLMRPHWLRDQPPYLLVEGCPKMPMIGRGLASCSAATTVRAASVRAKRIFSNNMTALTARYIMPPPSVGIGSKQK